MEAPTTVQWRKVNYSLNPEPEPAETRDMPHCCSNATENGKNWVCMVVKGAMPTPWKESISAEIEPWTTPETCDAAHFLDFNEELGDHICYVLRCLRNLGAQPSFRSGQTKGERPEQGAESAAALNAKCMGGGVVRVYTVHVCVTASASAGVNVNVHVQIHAHALVFAYVYVNEKLYL